MQAEKESKVPLTRSNCGKKCLKINNIFKPTRQCDSSKNLEFIPKHILVKIPESKQIACQEILNLKFHSRNQKADIVSVRTALAQQRQFSTLESDPFFEEKVNRNNGTESIIKEVSNESKSELICEQGPDFELNFMINVEGKPPCGQASIKNGDQSIS